MIDFQAAFALWLRTQCSENLETMQEDMDEVASRMYETWLDTPQEQFAGSAPSRFFDDYAPQELIDALMEYADNHVLIPDPLCDAINSCDDCVPILLEYLDKDLSDAQNQAVLERLSELQPQEMLEPCIRQIISEEDTKADQSVQAVLLFGQPAAKIALQTLQQVAHPDKVTDRLADIVASCGPCEGGLEYLCDLFTKREDAKAFYAQCLAKIGDERALPLLMEASLLPNLSYFDYTAVRDAIEELGADLDHEREYSGDRDYMALQEKTEDE